MKISVIICTKNRSQGLAECIKFVITQSFSPNELIIVDASDTENLDIKDDSRFTYIHAKLPLTHSRNLGVKNSSGDVVLFLDDDVALDKNFIKEIVKVFEKDLEKKIGGVTGNIVDIQRSKSFKLHMHSVVNRIFLLPTSGNGRFRASGCPTFIHGTKEVRNVEFLSGCCMAYRKEVFEDFKFDEDFPNAMFTDDEDFSYRVSRRYQNVYTPYAKVVHNSSPIGRDSHYTKAKMTVEARYYLLKKNFPQTLKYTLAFWWSVVGYFIQAITTMDKESFKGLISGVTTIKKGCARSIITDKIITDKEWLTRHLNDGDAWIKDYWKSRGHPHRSFLVERISKFSPSSVLEIGCACGPNLYHIAKRFPDADVRGIDINPMAVQKGNELFMQESISNVKLEVGKAQELEQFADKSFDVVFSDAVLIYVSPEEIKQVVKEMLRIGRVIVLNEWHSFNKWWALLLNTYCYLKLRYLLSRQRFRTLNCSFKPKAASLGLFVGHWVRNYKTLFEEFVPKEKIYITKLPKELWNDEGWQRWGAIIEVVG